MLPHASHFIAAGCFAFLFGVGLACLHPIALLTAVALIVGGCVIAVTHPREIALLGCIVTCVGVGCARVAVLPMNAVVDGTKADADVVIDAEPKIYPDKQQLVVAFADGTRAQTEVPLEPRFVIDDTVHIECTLTLPRASEDFAYDRYLERYNISALCKHPTIEWVSHTDTLRSHVLQIKQFIIERVRRTMPLPEQAIVLGMVFGVDHQLPQEITDAFRTTGTTHLLVISGSQIVLIIGVCTQLLQRAPIKRRSVMLSIVGILFCYATMTGWQASVLRAGICACCVFGVELLGRTSNGLRVLLYVAVFMTAITPYVLLYDAGFQLSFLATAGIIAFTSRLERTLQWMPALLGLRTAAATSLSAMVFTTPLIAYSFHTFSPISLFTNMVAVPISGILTVSGFGFSLATAALPQFGTVFAPTMFTLAHIFMHIVIWFSHAPYASITVPL